MSCKKQNPPIYFAKTKEEFAHSLSTALSQPPDRAIYKAFAKAHSWEQNIDHLEQLLQNI